MLKIKTHFSGFLYLVLVVTHKLEEKSLVKQRREKKSIIVCILQQ